MEKINENEISREILNAAFKIHSALGPGLFENVYERVLAHELSRRSLLVQRQVPIKVTYDGLVFDEAYRADLIVEGRVLIELKSQEHLMPVHRKQTLTYLKLANLPLGLLINFGAGHLKDGVARLANRMPERNSLPLRP
jgi:GxxExxY protein